MTKLIPVTCGVCGCIFGIDEAIDTELTVSLETFYCTRGHSLTYELDFAPEQEALPAQKPTPSVADIQAYVRGHFLDSSATIARALGVSQQRVARAIQMLHKEVPHDGSGE